MEKNKQDNDIRTVDYVPEIKDRPLYQSYQVVECPCLYAGEYPGNLDEEVAKRKVNQLVTFGIKHFVDLTEENELAPYSHLLPENTTYTRFPIRDTYTPKSVDDVHDLVNKLKEILKLNENVYIHCWGGVGRTGTIVACLIADILNIKDLKEVLKILRKNFSQMPKAAYRPTPDSQYQVNFVKKFIKSMN